MILSHTQNTMRICKQITPFIPLLTLFKFIVCLYISLQYCLFVLGLWSWLKLCSKYFFFFFLLCWLFSHHTFSHGLFELLPAVKTSFPSLNYPQNLPSSYLHLGCLWVANQSLVDWWACGLDLKILLSFGVWNSVRLRDGQSAVGSFQKLHLSVGKWDLWCIQFSCDLISGLPEGFLYFCLLRLN